MVPLLLALLGAAPCTDKETYVPTDREVLPPGPLQLVSPKPLGPPGPGCTDGEMGRDCAFMDDDQARFERERRRLESAPVVGAARPVGAGLCIPAALARRRLWLRTSAGHWELGPTEGVRIPRKRGPALELVRLSVRGVPADATLVVLPAAGTFPGDGGVLEVEVVGPVDVLALAGARASTFTLEASRDGGVSTAELTVLPRQGPELRVVGGDGATEQAVVHAWTAEAGAYDPELSTRRAVSLKGRRGRLPTLEPPAHEGRLSVVEASCGPLVGAAVADPAAAQVEVVLGKPAELQLPPGHRVRGWYLVEDVASADEEPCLGGTSQPWRKGVLTRGRPATVRVPAGPGRCLWLELETDDGAVTPWLVPVPRAGQSVQLPRAPPVEE